MNSITTSTGTTIHTVPSTHGTLVILGHPDDAPDYMHPLEAGRIKDGGFQPAPFMLGALSPETLRAIADLIDDAHQAANEPLEHDTRSNHLRAVPDTEPGDTK